ncbi:MAG: methyltransferase domain-containing protein [Peptococcaceae bacterium]|nr:methyltransferase domain-containing protein [Peptococcaceae bacterium]
MLKEYFNAMAPKWDTIMGPEVTEKLKEIVAGCSVRKGAKILDVACGTGILVPILLEAVGEGGEVVGIDFAPEMVRQAQAKNFGSNTRFLVADVMDLPFDEGSFDQVFCNGALPHFPDIPAALLEMKRVLRGNGGLVICHASSREKINETHRRIGEPVANDLLPTAGELKAMLEEAGYMDIVYEDTPDRFVVKARKALNFRQD